MDSIIYLEFEIRPSDIFCLMQSASPASLASLEARSPSADMFKDCGGIQVVGRTPDLPLNFLIGVYEEHFLLWYRQIVQTIKNLPPELIFYLDQEEDQ